MRSAVSYPRTPGYAKGSGTSEDAAASMDGVALTIRDRVFAWIESQSDGATDDEIELALEQRHQTASARRRELVLQGKIVDSGRTRLTSSGRKATVWVVCQATPQATTDENAYEPYTPGYTGALGPPTR